MMGKNGGYGYFLGAFILGIHCVNGLDISPAASVKTLHKGAYEAVKGTVNTVTEVVGTPVDIKDVHFFLHTAKDQGYPNHTVDPLEPSEIVTKGRVYFLIHGWTQSRQKTPWYRPLTEYLLKQHPDAHVVQIDWEKGAANNYASAAFGTESVGNIIGDVIKKLVVDKKVPRQNIIVIGHSLGGQISGWVGKRFRKLTKTTLPRIIALDPAGPLFSSRPEEKRLNKHDADIVMVLHSDGGKLGFGSSCGSIDFFPNGGSDQPGCYKVDLADVSTLTEPIWCDHQRGYDLFLEAVKSPCLFLAKKCENYDKFKEDKCENIAVSLGDLEASSSGSYYFKTTDKAPFIEIQELMKRNGKIFEYAAKHPNPLIDQCAQSLNLEKHNGDPEEKPRVQQNHSMNEKSKIDRNNNEHRHESTNNKSDEINDSRIRNEEHISDANKYHENIDQKSIGTNHKNLEASKHSADSNSKHEKSNQRKEVSNIKKNEENDEVSRGNSYSTSEKGVNGASVHSNSRNNKNRNVSQNNRRTDRYEDRSNIKNDAQSERDTYSDNISEERVSIKPVSSQEFRKISRGAHRGQFD